MQRPLTEPAIQCVHEVRIFQEVQKRPQAIKPVIFLVRRGIEQVTATLSAFVTSHKHTVGSHARSAILNIPLYRVLNTDLGVRAGGRARGIDEAAARKVLVYSFGKEVVNKLPWEAVRSRIQAAVNSTLATADI